MGSRLDTAALRELPIVCPDRDSTTQFAPFVDVDAKTWMALLDECDRLRAERDMEAREVGMQMASKLEAQMCLRDISEALDLPLHMLANGWHASLPIILARYEQALRDLEDVARAALTWAPGNAKIELANRLGVALAAGSGGGE